MTITLNLPPHIEQGLLAKAAANGLTLEGYLAELAAREAAPVDPSAMTGKQRAEEFLSWAQSHHPTPPLSDEAVSRTSMYPDRP